MWSHWGCMPPARAHEWARSFVYPSSFRKTFARRQTTTLCSRGALLQDTSNTGSPVSLCLGQCRAAVTPTLTVLLLWRSLAHLFSVAGIWTASRRCTFSTRKRIEAATTTKKADTSAGPPGRCILYPTPTTTINTISSVSLLFPHHPIILFTFLPPYSSFEFIVIPR